MPTDPVGRFLTALDPEHRESVGARPREEQERLAAAWERELEADTELDSLDELSPRPPRRRRRGASSPARAATAVKAAVRGRSPAVGVTRRGCGSDAGRR